MKGRRREGRGYGADVVALSAYWGWGVFLGGMFQVILQGLVSYTFPQVFFTY